MSLLYIEIEDASNIVNSVFDGKVELKDLLSALENLEKPLSEEKPEASLNSATDGEHLSYLIGFLFRIHTLTQVNLFFKNNNAVYLGRLL